MDININAFNRNDLRGINRATGEDTNIPINESQNIVKDLNHIVDQGKFKTGLQKMLSKILHSQNFDQAFDVAFRLLMSPVETIDLLNIGIRKDFPFIFNILQSASREGKFKDLQLNLKPFAKDFSAYFKDKIINSKNKNEIIREIVNLTTNIITLNATNLEEASDSLKKFIRSINNSVKHQNLKSIFISGDYAIKNTLILDEALSDWKKFSHSFGIHMDPMSEIGISMLGVLVKVRNGFSTNH
ncbi:MAG: hypothetical protein HRT47_01920 [Candidatus Caenarcaniphilales bacterium]|nr:hypothetical protein [Candidatus Caenarcaniphilales bacterium]